MHTIRDIALTLGVTEATIRKKLKLLSVPKDTNGRLIITTDKYMELLYKYYPSMYAKVSHTVVPLVKRKDSKSMNKGKIQRVVQRSGKVYYYIRQLPIGYDEHGNVMYAKTKQGYNSKEEAELARAQLIASRDESIELSLGTYVNYCSNFIEKQEWAEGTKVGYRGVLKKYFKPYFKNTQIKDLTVAKLMGFVESITLNRQGCRGLLQTTLRKLYRTEVITKDLYSYLDFPRGYRSLKKKRKPLTRQQLVKLFEWVKGHKLEYLIHLLFKSGLRIGEALALYNDEVELLEDDLVVININSSIGIVGKGLYGRKATKTVSSKRKTYVYDSYLWQLLKKKKESNTTKWLCENRSKVSHLSYTNVYDNFIRPAREDLGFEVYPHLARHTFISHSLANGIKPEDIAKQVGHTDTTMIYKVYGKSVDELKDSYKNFRII